MYSTYMEKNMVQYLSAVFGWMFLGLSVTAYSAYSIGTNPALIKPLLASKFVIIGLFIAEIILVIAITSLSECAGNILAGFLFIVFSALNGVLLSSIFVAFNINTIYLAFIVAAGIFGSSCIYGYVTKTDLSQLGGILFMSLSGLLIATIANIFLANQTLDWVISYSGVVIFTVYTAFDIQEAKFMPYSPINSALDLYLDFFNLFIFVLQILGDDD